MKKRLQKFWLLTAIIAVFMALMLGGCSQGGAQPQETISLAVVTDTPTPETTVTETPTAAPTEAPTASPTQAAESITSTPKAESIVPEVTETPEPESTASVPEETEEDLLDPDGTYTTKDDVALYLYQYGELPQNFMTKKAAQKLGWSGGGLDDYAYGMCIGGDRFGNYEGNLPDGNYHECDIDTLHKKKRGAKRIVYSDDGRIYYTDDHYETFTLLYGEE